MRSFFIPSTVVAQTDITGEEVRLATAPDWGWSPPVEDRVAQPLAL
jgi:hypothetical protein